MDTSGDTLLSVSSAESNELYETALSSFHESDDAFGFVDEPIQVDVPVGSTSDDCRISYNEGVELTSFDSFFDGTYCDYMGREFFVLRVGKNHDFFLNRIFFI